MRKNLRTNHRRRGFSIPEVLIAVVVGSMLLATTVGLSWVFADSSRVLIGSASAENDAALFLDTVTSDLASAAVCDPSGLGLPIQYVSDNELTISKADAGSFEIVKYRKLTDVDVGYNENMGQVVRSVWTVGIPKSITNCIEPWNYSSSETVLQGGPDLDVSFSLVGPAVTAPGDCSTPALAIECRGNARSLAVSISVELPAAQESGLVTKSTTTPLSLASSTLPRKSS